MTPTDESTIETEVTSAIAQQVIAGRCILFLGAGVHCPPPDGSAYSYPAEERPPMGGRLSEALAAKSGFAGAFTKESINNLQRVSLYYQKRFSRSQLVDRIREEVDTNKKPSPALRALAELNFPLVITTNFDTLFERSLAAAGKSPRKAVYSPESKPTPDCTPDPTAQRPFIFKIHGDIDQPESIVITDEDYIDFVLRMSDKNEFHPVPEIFRYNFKRWSTLFVGYSLLDYNLRLLFKTLRWKIDQANIPDAYSVDLYPDPLILDVWQNERRYIKFIAQDVWTFVPRLYQLVTGKVMP